MGIAQARISVIVALIERVEKQLSRADYLLTARLLCGFKLRSNESESESGVETTVSLVGWLSTRMEGNAINSLGTELT